MSRRCELTGKGVLSGNHVSHAKNRTKRVFRPNIQSVSLSSESLDRIVSLKVSMHALKTVDRKGGLDAFLLRAKDSELSSRALRLKKLVAKRLAATAAA
jgi:large subunit ribosomal protein L28